MNLRPCCVVLAIAALVPSAGAQETHRLTYHELTALLESGRPAQVRLVSSDEPAGEAPAPGVLTFDSRLDGAGLDIRDPASPEAALWTSLAARYGLPMGRESVTVRVGGEGPVMPYDPFEYFRTVYNRDEGATILDEGDRPFVIRTVTYPEMVRIFQTPGDHVVLFGGSWCSNTRAVIKLVNRAAKAHGIATVYNLDLRLDGDKLHVRDTKSPYARLYVDLVNTWLPGIVTVFPVDKISISYPGSDGQPVKANRLQVPYLFVYNKDRRDDQGRSAPVRGQVELMYTWKTIQSDYVDVDGSVGANHRTYTEAVDALFQGLTRPN